MRAVSIIFIAGGGFEKDYTRLVHLNFSKERHVFKMIRYQKVTEISPDPDIFLLINRLSYRKKQRFALVALSLQSCHNNDAQVDVLMM